MSSDDARRMSIFEGSVVLSNGTMVVRADRIVVRQDADGFQFATAYGKPVQFRQRGDAKGGKEGIWTEGEALRIEVDSRNERVELFEQARVRRGEDVVNGEYIFVDQRTEFFSVSAAKGAAPTSPGGRVKAVIQPKTKAEAK
jgi:lipopolysaccharide export system protein LptA